MRKPCNYDTIQIGEVLGEKEVLITDEMIRTYAQAIKSSRLGAKDYPTHLAWLPQNLSRETFFL